MGNNMVSCGLSVFLSPSPHLPFPCQSIVENCSPQWPDQLRHHSLSTTAVIVSWVLISTTVALFNYTKTLPNYALLAKKRSLLLQRSNPAEKRPSNCHLLIDSQGIIRGRYNKAHLFSINTKEVKLREEDFVFPGEEVVPPIATPVGNIALSIVSFRDLRCSVIYKNYSTYYPYWLLVISRGYLNEYVNCEKKVISKHSSWLFIKCYTVTDWDFRRYYKKMGVHSFVTLY